jgi:ATP-dependent helicase/nuclease subunit A
LETPGGLKIQTIHSFAQSLLAAFPAEAGIVPGFQPIEGRAEQELVRRTLAALLETAEASGNKRLLDDVSALSLRLGEGGAESYLMACARAHEALGEGGQIEPAIRRLMELPDESVEDYIFTTAATTASIVISCACRRREPRWAQNGIGHADTIERWLR